MSSANKNLRIIGCSPSKYCSIGSGQYLDFITRFRHKLLGDEVIGDYASDLYWFAIELRR